MADGFTDQDRLNLTNVCRDMEWMREQTEKRMAEIEALRDSGERRLHERVDEVHTRVNKVRNFLISFASILSPVSAGIGYWLKSKLTGNP